MGMAGLNLEPHFSKFGKPFLFYSCTSDVIVISRNSQWGESCKKPLKPSSPGIQRFLANITVVVLVLVLMSFTQNLLFSLALTLLYISIALH